MTLRLSTAMLRALAMAGDDWGHLPDGLPRQSRTVSALVRRGLIELRKAPEYQRWRGLWHWRLTHDGRGTRDRYQEKAAEDHDGRGRPGGAAQ